MISLVPRASGATSYDLVYAYWDAGTSGMVIENGPVVGSDWIAWANFSDQIQSTGWSFLQVVTNEQFLDKEQAYAAGLLEGHLTCDLMQNYWWNMIDEMCDDSEGEDENDIFCRRLWRYLRANKKWMETSVEQHESTDPFWHQVSLILRQIQGMQDGCTAHFVEDDRHEVLHDFSFLLFSLLPEKEDLFSALSHPIKPEHRKPGSCSAMIKWVWDDKGPDELYIGHNTWSDFSDMVRVLKNYEFYFHRTYQRDSPVVPGYKMTFSSYPGAVHSIDDFYLISSGLVTLETTLENYNDDLWKLILPNGSVPEFIRSMVANRLANSGWMWTEVFSRHNSGTYNNQWMIVDYKKFEKHSNQLNDGLFWIIEQLPGTTKAEDQTGTLRYQGYWPSYNIPYLPSIANLSGQLDLVQKNGSHFSYEENPRAKIFRRDQDKVVDADTMIKLLRYNDYLNDPLSVCNCTPPHNAMIALASRGDLNPENGTYPLDEFGHAPFGATDVKVTSYKMFLNLEFLAISGPTYDDVPPFQWSTYEQKDYYRHEGMPDLWKFERVLATWN